MLNEFHDKIPDGLDTKVFTEAFLPEALPLDDPRKAEIKLGQLLCMTAGYNGEGGSPTGVVNGKAEALKPVPGQNIRDLDMSSIHCPLWTDPGAGYSYSSPSPHVASIVLRHVTGMELQDYIRQRLAKPMGWGPWGYCLHRGNFDMPHANGAGSIALHATDALRFGYCLLHDGRWKDEQLVPADYIKLCHKPSPYNPHCPFSLQFEHNADGHVAGAPRDAFYKSGAGGFGIFVVPSLDMVIYKLGGNNGQYDPGAHRYSADVRASTLRATTGNRSRARRLTKAVWAATMACGACWKWSPPPSEIESRGRTLTIARIRFVGLFLETKGGRSCRRAETPTPLVPIPSANAIGVTPPATWADWR